MAPMQQELIKKQILGFLNTPPLWAGEQFGIQQFDFPDMDMNDFVTAPIPSNIRLGHQMEYVFKQLILHSEKYEIQAHNLLVKKEKRTIGEIDFILKEVHTSKLIHVELTYKFYIIDLEITAPIHRLIGPNKRDMFFAKMEKIKNEQFKLLHTKEGANALVNNDIDHAEIDHQCCFKAQLFQGYGVTSSGMHPINKKCIVGYWLRFKVFNTAEFSSHKFYIPNKWQWAIAPHDQIVWLSHLEVLPEVNLRMSTKKSPMVWVKKSADVFEKIFVVWW